MSKIAKTTIGIMGITMVSKVLGFLRELVLASSYGTSMYSDAYLVAYSIPGVLFAMIGMALSTTFIPIYYESNNIGGDRESIKLTNNVFNIVIILGLIISIIGFIFVDPLVKIFAIGFNGETLEITKNFTKIMIFSTLFIGTSSIITSFLQIKDRFILSTLVGIPFNVIIIISIIFSSKGNPYLLAWGTLVAMASKLIFQMPSAYKSGYKYKFYINIKDKYIKKMIFLLGPVFIGVAVNQINTMIDRSLASTLVEGSISALNYANRLNGFVMGMFIASIAAVVYPMLSKLSSEDNKSEFNKSIVTSVNSVSLITIPISIGAIVLASPIVKILFQRGSFDSMATNMTAGALVMYSIGMIGFGLRDVLGKVFYSLKDTKTPMVNGAISMIINIILNLIFIKFIGYLGLALATSLSALICIVLLFNSLNKKIGYFGQDKIISTMFKSLAASVVMGVVTVVAYKLLANILGVGFIQEAVSLFGAIGVGAIVYSGLVVLFKVEEVNVVVSILKRKLNR